MQLDLFNDNRPGILINMADEFIRSRNLVQAVSVYQQLLSEYPDDRSAAPLLKLVDEWRDLLSGIKEHPADQAYLPTVWLRLESLSHPALRSTAVDMLLDALGTCPNPEQIFAPPRFHLGQILMEAGRYTEAAPSFLAALSNSTLERGKFLAWRADALTLAGNDDEALKGYLAAFLEDPFSIDLQSIKNEKISDLRSSLHFEATDEIAETEEVAWLPVWGWLQGVFTLPLQRPIVFDELESQVNSKALPTARLWYELLTMAEQLRTVQRDDRRMAEARRMMKRLNEEMFDCYLQKIRGTRQ